MDTTLTDTLAVAGDSASLIDRFGVIAGVVIAILLLYFGVRHFMRKPSYYSPSNGGGTGGGSVDSTRPRPDPRDPTQRT